MAYLPGVVRTLLMIVYFVALVPIMLAAQILFLPSRTTRVRIGNIYGKVLGRGLIFLSGCTVDVTGTEHLDPKRPAIYIMNHQSMVDVFLGIWLAPIGTVGVAKKEVLFVPFFGQIYFLSGHLWIDRANRTKAVASLKKLGETVRKYALSLYIWPEGTRSRSGKLGKFKKGFIHFAIQTGMPVVPLVMDGSYAAMPPGKLIVRPQRLTVKVLPAIDTSSWTKDRAEEIAQEVRQIFADDLGEE